MTKTYILYKLFILFNLFILTNLAILANPVFAQETGYDPEAQEQAIQEQTQNTQTQPTQPTSINLTSDEAIIMEFIGIIIVILILIGLTKRKNKFPDQVMLKSKI